MDSARATRWGFAGAGRIANDFAICLQSLPNHEIVAVVGRLLTEAREFATKNSIPKFYETYEELAKDADVDIVYVATINPHHFKAAMIMLEGNKHVLVEKPMFMTAAQTEKAINLARQKKLFIMEGMWSRFFPIYTHLRELLDRGAIGEPNWVHMNFCSPMMSFERIKQKELGGSVTLDVGVYAVQLSTLVYKGEKPERIVATGFLNDTGADEAVSATLYYSNRRTATFILSSRCKMDNVAVIAGPTQFLKLKAPFHSPTQLETPTETITIPLPTTISKDFKYSESAGLCYEAEEIRKCLLQGKTECPLMTLDESLTLAFIMEEIRKQIGVKG